MEEFNKSHSNLAGAENENGLDNGTCYLFLLLDNRRNTY